jgi:hypothetical protein
LAAGVARCWINLIHSGWVTCVISQPSAIHRQLPMCHVPYTASPSTPLLLLLLLAFAGQGVHNACRRRSLPNRDPWRSRREGALGCCCSSQGFCHWRFYCRAQLSTEQKMACSHALLADRVLLLLRMLVQLHGLFVNFLCWADAMCRCGKWAASTAPPQAGQGA